LPGGDGEGVDVTGSREIRMMPFGVGRKICAGLGIAMLHLEYFVAVLVKEFQWKEVPGDDRGGLRRETRVHCCHGQLATPRTAGAQDQELTTTLYNRQYNNTIC
jgi:cytochrome P450